MRNACCEAARGAAEPERVVLMTGSVAVLVLYFSSCFGIAGFLLPVKHFERDSGFGHLDRQEKGYCWAFGALLLLAQWLEERCSLVGSESQLMYTTSIGRVLLVTLSNKTSKMLLRSRVASKELYNNIRENLFYEPEVATLSTGLPGPLGPL